MRLVSVVFGSIHTKLLKDVAPERIQLIQNSFFLFVLQGVNYILPLITLPYLARVLAPAKFGLVAFAQSLMQYFIILTDYGFNFSATRDIAVNREDREKIAEIFSSVMLIKLSFLLTSSAILVLLVAVFDRFRTDSTLYFLAFGVVVGNSLFPVWFFQGMERMKYVTFLNALSKLVFTICIFIFIRHQSDYLYVPLMRSLGYCTAGGMGLWVVFKDFRVRLRMPSKQSLIYALKDSFQFFLSRVSVSLYTSSNTFFLGLFAGDVITGYYSAAEKLYVAVKNAYQPLVNALYPFMSKHRDVKFFKRVFSWAVGLNLVICLGLFVFGRDILYLIYGDGFEDSVGIFKAFVIALLVVVPSILLGYPFLAALRREQYANGSVVVSSVFHFVALPVVLLLLNRPFWVSGLVVLTECIALSIRWYGVWKHRPWI